MISIITAMTRERVIGDNNKLPWHIPEELKLFRRITSGHTVIMGKRTFESIGKPLPNRNNIVLSSTEHTSQDVHWAKNISDALQAAQGYNKEIFVIGGAQVYQQFLPLADRLLISYIKYNYPGTILFPEFNINEWQKSTTEIYPDFDFVTYLRTSVCHQGM
jgi:dihydrofolate reductase